MTVMEVTVNPAYKSQLFEMIFSDKRELLSLYEHQSTYNPNLPLRYLFYIADLYSGMVKDCNLYGSKTILLPAPKFIIFYNGKNEYPNRQELKLSASYNVQDKKPSLELRAIMLNINPGHNKKLMKACKTLKDYSEYVSRVRLYAETMDIEIAVEQTINECIQEGILSDFLMKNKAEAKKVSIYEYDEEKHMRQTREEGFDDGFDQGYGNGYDNGYDCGLEIGIKAYIETLLEAPYSKNETEEKLIKNFSLTPERAKEMMSKYWKPENNI